jgi:hypothetical protein
MTRAVYRFREHTITPDTGPDAEPITFAMECMTCEATSDVADDADAGALWALAHLKTNPGHVRYREHITRPYLFEPGAWQ